MGEALSSPAVAGSGIALGRGNARFLEQIIGDVCRAAQASTGNRLGRFALAAVGSFGRGAVALRSDADVRILIAKSSSPLARLAGGAAKAREAATKFAEALLYPLWDAGLSIGHQVMEADEALELAQTDLASATTLLDLRCLAGDASLVGELEGRAAAGVFAEGELGSFVDRLEAEATARHARFGASVYLLEPEVKGGAGGLRDLDGARWAVQARFRVRDEIAGGAAQGGRLGVWSDLVRLGVLVPREAQEIGEAEEFLWRVRNRLHAHSGRRSDRFTFEEQEVIAAELGYGDERALAAERLMQDYYVHARVVTRARERLLERARPPRRRGKPVEVDLGGGVRLFDGQVTIAGAAELARDPALALRAYAACVRHDAPVLPFAREAIARQATDASWCEALRNSREATQHFVELLCHVAEARTKRGSIAGELSDVGLLLAMIPEFQPVMGRVHHDVYHVYTVDVHSVAALDCLRALCRGELAHEYPLASRLAAEIALPRPLFLATLLHDVGKGYPDSSGSRKHHSKSGAELCDVILPRLGLSASETAEARALVLQHLAMYHTATRRDLDDPATVGDFSKLVRGREGLRELYLLTMADITTTSPTAMTTWKARMLDDLYFSSDTYLGRATGGAAEHDFDEERAARIWEEAAVLWVGPDAEAKATKPGKRGSLQTAFFHEFVGSMPERYLFANTPESIVAHAGVVLDRGDQPVHVALVPSRHADVAELCVVADDRPGLLARIAAAITAARFEVLAAQVYSRPRETEQGTRVEAVDLFWVRDRSDGVDGIERGLPQLARDLTDVCSGKTDPADLLRSRTGSTSPWRERPSPAVLTDIVVDDRASPRHSVLEVFAKDRPGLLYTLARVFHELGLSIALSKINTEGTKVADVFYVSELDGTKVMPGHRVRAIRDALTSAIGE